jgi:hypothetical protein
MVKCAQPQNDSKNDLREHINSIKKLSIHFDAGDITQARQIAAQIKILLEDTSKPAQILLHLDQINPIKFLDSLPRLFNMGNRSAELPLVALSIVNIGHKRKIEWKPRLSKCRRNWKSFNDWRSGVVLIDQKGNEFSRKMLILNVADNAHGAPMGTLGQSYTTLSKSYPINSFIEKEAMNKEAQENFIKAMEFTSVRQIAFELIESLEKILSV